MTQAPASPATQRELRLIESWSDNRPRLACYLDLLPVRRFDPDVDVEAIRHAAEVALGRRKEQGNGDS